MIMKANKQIGFIYKDDESIDRILKDGDVVFERGFLREKTSTTLPITFGGVGKDLKDYKIYGNTKQQLLPDGYTQVDYIKSTGTQYIDTGVYGNLKTEIRVKASSNGESAQLFGDITTQSRAISCNFGFAQAIGSRFGNKNVAVILGNYITIDIPFELIENKNGMYIDNVEVIAFDTTDEFTTTNTLLLLNRNSSSGAIANRGFGNLYNCEIYDGNTLIRNFIPCYRNSDNEAGLYDLVNNVFYTNQGTGVFTYGSVAPTPDAPIEIVSCGDLITDSQDINYGKYKIPVNVRSDNLFDKDNANIITAYIGENYNWVYSGSAICYRIKCKPNTSYTISCFNSNETIFRGAITDSENVPTSGNNLSIYSIVRRTDNTPITINTGTNTKYILVQLSSSQYLTSIETLQIVEGSTAPTKYIPYYNETTNIYLDEPLRKTKDGSYVDYIDFVNQKVVRNIKEVILDGNENWVTASAGQNAVRFVWNTYQGAKIPSSLNVVGDILSDKFIPRTANETANKKDGIAIAESGKFVIYYELFKESTSTQFKTWLSQNNVTVDYVLATPTEESITLPNIPTINGNNTLNIETEITPSQVFIKYKSNT